MAKYKQSNPSFQLAANELNASGRRFAIRAEEDTDGATFTAPFGERWVAEIEIFQEFGVAGIEETLRPLVNTIVALEYSPDAAAGVSADNPTITGQVRVPPFTLVDAGIREFTALTITMEFEEGTYNKAIV